MRAPFWLYMLKNNLIPVQHFKLSIENTGEEHGAITKLTDKTLPFLKVVYMMFGSELDRFWEQIYWQTLIR